MNKRAYQTGIPSLSSNYEDLPGPSKHHLSKRDSNLSMGEKTSLKNNSTGLAAGVSTQNGSTKIEDKKTSMDDNI